MKKINYLKVGLFVFLSCIIFLVFIISLGDKRFLSKRKEFIVEFKYVWGLKEYSPVKVLGVDVGFVRKIKLDTLNKRVLVYLSIKKDIDLPADSTFFINTLGLFGEKYLEITPGKEKNLIRPGQIVKGEELLDFHSIFKKFSDLTFHLEKVVKDEDLKLRFKNLIANFNTLLKDFDIVLKNLRSKKGTLGKILFEDELYNNINDLIKDLKEHPWKLLRRPKKRYKKK